MNSTRFASTGTQPSFASRVGLATVAAGLLDMIYAFWINAANGVPPARVLQFIASGLLGMAAFDGDPASVLVGLACHFSLMAAFAAGLAVMASRISRERLPVWALGAAGGLGLYGLMTFIVVPLSRTPALPPLPLGRVALEVAVHVVVVRPVAAAIMGGTVFGPRRDIPAQG